MDVVARDLPLETTSATAAALWYPYRAFPYERVSAWSATSFTEFERLAADEDTGVAMVEGTELHRSRTADPWWSAAVPALTRVRAMPAPYVDGWSFRAPVVEMPVYLRWLAGQVVEAGGTITRMALGGLPDQAEVVVNASGLGARLIGPTPRCSRCAARWSTSSSSASTGGGSTGPGRRTWCRARRTSWWAAPTRRGSGAVRRTRRPPRGSWSGRACWCPSWRRARVLRHRVGLRPARPGVRLEEERCGDARVVHCYGHGGAGVTLSWGCADEVAALVGPA